MPVQKRRALGALATWVLFEQVAGAQVPPEDLGALDLRELAAVPVVSVSRRRQAAGEVPAAVFVLTAEDLRRAGVLTIPDALRLVPGTQVARLSSHDWAISVRGWNGQFADKLLVLIDGRSVYTPLFSGVFWSVHDLVLEDIERIEVVRGSGGTLWGANAVNGVINIVTREASRTRGVQAFVVGGNEPLVRAGVSHELAVGAQADLRLFARFVEHGEAVLPDDRGADDSWRAARGGARLDWRLTEEDELSVWAEGQVTGLRQNIVGLPSGEPPFATDLHERRKGHDVTLVTRYQHGGDRLGDVTAQASLTRLEHPVLQLRERRTTFEVDAQHSRALAAGVRLTWGLGYTRSSDDIPTTFSTSFAPTSRALDLPSAFAELQLDFLRSRLRLFPGGRVEHNDFTGWEVQPSLRLWAGLSGAHALWLSAARAVRTPSRLDRDIIQNSLVLPPTTPGELPTVRQTRGSPGVSSEIVAAYDVGWRAMPGERWSWDLALFVHHYRDLVTLMPLPVETTPEFVIQPSEARNGPEATTYGGELSLSVRPWTWQRWRASWSVLRFADGAAPQIRGLRDQPEHQGVLIASTDLAKLWQLDLVVRYVDDLPIVGVDRYVTADARVSLNLGRRWELSLVGRDLLGRHAEFRSRAQNPPTDVGRSVYAQIAARL